jgi:membrane-associated phospholipid phosphatase
MRLFLGAIACGIAAVAVVPFEPHIIRVCNVTPQSPLLAAWGWIDSRFPAVLMTIATLAGAALLVRARTDRGRRAGFVLLVAFLVTLLVTGGLKAATSRLRPTANADRAGKLWSPIDLKDDRSFPSGHVSGTAAICAAFWLASRRRPLRNVVWLLPAGMIYDRVCLGVHWPSDTLAGAAVGLSSAAAVATLVNRGGADRVLARCAPGASSYARFAVVVGAWLMLTQIWIERPLGRDPASGEAVAGFVARPQPLRAWLEPVFGPPLHLALEDLRALLLPLALWTFVVLFAFAGVFRKFALRGLILFGVAIVTWVVVFWFGWAPPDRFVAKDRRGVFVDWHLHAGDFDAGKRVSVRELESREKQRGVDWPILTHHSAIPKKTLASQFGVLGMEWSGRLTPEMIAAGGVSSWTTAHVLMIGDQIALDAATPGGGIGIEREAGVVGAARDRGALCIVAHLWRSEKNVKDCPTFDELVAAGAHGFEVGNRRRETDPAALARLRELDRRCREQRLLRFSFSDDHGIPSGSPCVTFLEGVDEHELESDGGLGVLARLRSPDGGGITPIPLLFHPGDPTLFPPAFLAPPVIAFEYFRSLELLQRASWLAFLLLAGAWVCRAKPRSYTE